MITLAQCAAYSGLACNEMFGGVTPSERHRQLLASYLSNLDYGAIAVREMIVCDLRSFLDLGVKNRAADLLVVLGQFLSDFPEARSISPGKPPTGITPQFLNVRRRFRVYDHCFAPDRGHRPARASGQSQACGLRQSLP